MSDNKKQEIKAKDMKQGEVIKGHLMRMRSTVSKFTGKAERSPVLLIDGKEVTVWKAGNLTTTLLENINEKTDYGSFVTIKCLGPKGEFKTNEGVKSFNKFNVNVDTDNKIEVPKYENSKSSSSNKSSDF